MLPRRRRFEVVAGSEAVERDLPHGTPINSVVKAIEVLKLLNRAGVASVQQLSHQSGIPKPTIVRIVATLAQCGIVQQLSRRAGYSLTSNVLELSSGYYGLPALLEVAAPVATKLTEDIRWPSAVATLDLDAMVVRYSTIPFSPYAHVTSTMNKRLSLLQRAHGRTYLAFCPKAELETLLKGMTDVRRMNLSERRRLLVSLREVRAAGYAKRPVEVDPRTSTIAAPIFVANRVRGTIGITFFRSVVDQKLEASLAKRLISAASSIETSLQSAADISLFARSGHHEVVETGKVH